MGTRTRLAGVSFDLKSVICFPHFEQARAFVGIDVGGVEDKVGIAVEPVEYHAVAAVFVVNKAVCVAPGAEDAAAVADRQRLHVKVLRPRAETGPEHV